MGWESMRQTQTVHVEVAQGQCWGQRISEDTGTGVCQLCVEVCPEVFEKPVADWCAFTRPNVDATQHIDKIYEAIARCPVEAIVIHRNGQDEKE